MLCTQQTSFSLGVLSCPASPRLLGLSYSAHVRAWKSSWATQSPALHALLMRMLASQGARLHSPCGPGGSPKAAGQSPGDETQVRSGPRGDTGVQLNPPSSTGAREGSGGDPVTPSSAMRAPSRPGRGRRWSPRGSQNDSRGRAPVVSQPLPGVKGGPWGV